MKIAIIGTGYVGLTAGTCLAETGNEVVCVDINAKKIESLNQGKCPLYEPGLHELIERNVKNSRLSFSTNVRGPIGNSEIILCCVGTPTDKNQNADITRVLQVAKNFGKYINGYKLFIVKSTVPLGTTQKCKKVIRNEINKRKMDYEFDVASNPEFLRQGSAVKDTINPERIIAGVENTRTAKILEKLYTPFVSTGRPIVYTNLKTAELIKYAANAFLCTKISFINEMAQFCEKVGANIKDIAHGIGLDRRIAPHFLEAGIGYGGNCLKKDLNALINTGKMNQHHFSLLHTVEAINEHQRNLVFQKLEEQLGDIKRKKIAVWGLSFKPNTDDLRDSPAIDIVAKLVRQKASVRVYDPLSAKTFVENYFKNNPNLTLAQTNMDAARNADALVILTQWDEFRNINLQKLASIMKNKIIIDGRNIYDPLELKRAGFIYDGIGI